MNNKEKLTKLTIIGILIGYVYFLLDEFPELREFLLKKGE
jgi:hypothetical protein